MTGRWKAWKTSAQSEQGSNRNEGFPTLPTAPWESLKRFPHSHSLDDDDSLLRTYEQHNQGTFLSSYRRGHFYRGLTEVK